MSRASRTTWDAIRAAGALPRDAHLAALAEGLIAGATITPDDIAAPGEPTRVHHAAMARTLLDACVQACASLQSPAHATPLLDRVPGVAQSRARERARRIRATLHAAAMAWSALPQQERSVIAQLAQGHWAGAIEELLTEPRAAVRASVAILAGEAHDAGLAHALTTLIADSSPEVGEHAERALVCLAAALPEDARIREAVASAAGSIGAHHRRGAVLALAAIADRISLRACAHESWAAAARAILGADASADRKGDAGSNEAVRALVRFSRTSVVSDRAIEWLKVPSLSRACVDRLSRPRVRSDHAAVLAAAHLFEHPGRAMAIRAVKLPAVRAARNGEPAILPLDLPEHEEDARSQAPRIAALLKASDTDLTAWLEPLLNDPSPRVRLSLAHRAPLALRRDLVHDSHPLVARAAAIRLSRGGTIGDVRATARLDSSAPDDDGFHGASRSAHSGVRVLAGAERATFGAMGLSWILAWRKHFAAEPDACTSHVASMLRQADAKLDEGIELVRALGLSTRLHDALTEAVLSTKATPRQAATIVALLGQADPARTTAAGRAIAAALAHADARVRANAIEALAHRTRHAAASPGVEAAIAAQVSAPIAPLLAPLVEDAHHRVRSTLARAVLVRAIETSIAQPVADISAAAGASPAAPVALTAAGTTGEITPKMAQAVLTDMLIGSQPLDRLAGVWAAGRVVLANSRRPMLHGSGSAPLLQARLAEIARFDVEPKVRWRAACIIERLEGELRASWSKPVRMTEHEPQGANA